MRWFTDPDIRQPTAVSHTECCSQHSPVPPGLSQPSPRSLQHPQPCKWPPLPHGTLRRTKRFGICLVCCYTCCRANVEGRQAQCPLLSSLLQGCPEASGRRWKGLREGRDSASGKRKMMEMWLPVKGFFAHFQAHPFSSHFWIQVFFFFLNQSTFCWIDWVNNIAWTGTYTS